MVRFYIILGVLVSV